MIPEKAKALLIHFLEEDGFWVEETPAGLHVKWGEHGDTVAFIYPDATITGKVYIIRAPVRRAAEKLREAEDWEFARALEEAVE